MGLLSFETDVRCEVLLLFVFGSGLHYNGQLL